MRFRHLIAVVLCLGTCGLAVPSGSADHDGLPMVDYRLAPQEQASRIHQLLSSRDRQRLATFSIVTLRDGSRTDTGERSHIVVDRETATPDYLRGMMSRQPVDGISWRGPLQDGACDSDQECQDKTDAMCRDAGHGGVKNHTVRVTVSADGTKTCSGDCMSNGAVAFVTCGVPSCYLCG